MLLLAVAAGAIVAALVALVRPELPVRLPHLLVPVAAVVGAIAVGAAEAAPTGWMVLDLVLRAGFGALVPLAASRAGTIATAWLLVVAVVTLFIVSAPAPAVAGVAAGACLALGAAGVATPAARALAAAAAIGPLAHATWPLFTGASAAAMAVATVPVLLAGWFRAPRRTRRAVGVAFATVVLVVAVGAVVGGLAALGARDDIDRGVALATDGIELLGDDDTRARQQLRSAAGHFDAAEETLRAWWARPALLVPGVAQQSRAVSTMASAGADLARTAADASDEADVDAVRPRDGRVDLAALEALQDPLDRSLGSLRQAAVRLADVRSPLLLAPVADRLTDLRTEVADALVSAELAARAVDVAPDLLGADGPRRYFLALQTPSELRGNGGFMGSWAEVVTDDGRFALARAGRLRDLIDGGAGPDGRTIEGEDDFTGVWGQDPARSWNVAFSPDHPTVGRVIAQLYPQSGGDEIDGVFAVTPTAFAAFLELTGPIEVPGYPRQLTSENAARILLHEQYLEFPTEQTEDREGFLADSVSVLFDRLTSGELPGPSALAEELGAVVESRDLQLWSAHDDEQELFERMGATGSAERHDVDAFGVVGQNWGGNKIDWFLRRSIAYDVAWDPDSGAVAGTITATIENLAPASGLPSSIIGWGGGLGENQLPVEDGENLMLLTVYSTFPIQSITVDGESQPFAPGTELGHETGRFYLRVPAGTSRRVVATVEGEVAEGPRYVIRPLRQPTVVPDVISARLSVPEGWELETSGGDASDARLEGTAAERLLLEVVASRSVAAGLLERLRGAG